MVRYQSNSQDDDPDDVWNDAEYDGPDESKRLRSRGDVTANDVGLR